MEAQETSLQQKTLDTSFEHLRHWIEFYSKASGINFVVNENLPFPAAVPDNSKKQQLTILLNPKLLKEKYNLSNEELLFVLFHEVEHLIEDAQLRQSADGSRISNQRRIRLEEAKHLAGALHILENIMRDIFVNNNVLQKAPALLYAKDTNYRNYFFKEKDFLNMPVVDKDGKDTGEKKALPKHLQFAYTILREAMLPDEKCNIDLEVRKIVDRLKTFGSIERAITGNLADRLEQIWKAIEPTYKKLLEEDIKNNRDNNNGDGNSNKNNKGNGQGQQGQNQGQSSPSGNEAPQNPFDKLYKDMEGLPHILEDNLNPEDLEKVKKQIDKKIDSSKPKSKERMELEKRAENMGVDPENTDEFEKTIKQLSEYDRFLEQLKELNDPDSGNGVMEEIYNLFQRIRSNRLKPRIKSRGPVGIEDGVRLHPGSLASGIGELRSGNFDPLMFQKDIKVDKEKQFVGEFELSIVADGSGSMKGLKNAQQKIACLIMFEALKMLHDKLEMERMNLVKPVNFSTDGIMFDGASTRKVKDPGTDFTDKEKLEAYSVLDYANGNKTNDYDGLDKIITNIQSRPQEYLEGLRTGKVKKIVFVLTDGGSSNAEKMKEKITYLRSIGVLVYGIGITSAGNPVVDLFIGSDSKLGFGKVCENPSDLAKTMKDLLLPHLEKI